LTCGSFGYFIFSVYGNLGYLPLLRKWRKGIKENMALQAEDMNIIRKSTRK
jgi:hypothetical protein